MTPKTDDPLRIGLAHNVKRIDPTTGDDTDAEFDAPTTINAIKAALESLGHEVVLIEARPELARTLHQMDLDLVFNIAEGLRGRNREAQVPALLELLDIPYTGSDPTTLCLTLDKGLSKRIVAAAGVRTARAWVASPGAAPQDLRFPVIVKPNAEGSSKGISSTSVVHDAETLEAVLQAQTRRYSSSPLVEEYLPGREFTVALLGKEPRVLPAMEIVFDEGAGDHPVYSFEHKIDADPSVRFVCPAELDDELGEALREAAATCFRALGCRDVARIDFRLDADGVPNFIECNPLPGLSPGFSDICVIAEKAGYSYEELIAAIVEPAIERLEELR